MEKFMKSRLSFLVLTLFSLQFYVSDADAHQRSWPGKNLSETFPEGKNFVQKQVNLDAAKVQWIEKSLGSPIQTEDRAPIFYAATSASGVSGWVIFLDYSGANGKAEIGLALDSKGQVINISLLENSENKDLTQRPFLNQFRGKTAFQKFKVGEEIKAPKGQENGAQSIATAVRRGLLISMAGLKIGVNK
jgi:hypothetical protein